MTTQVTIRDATESDVPAITDLWIEFVDFHARREPHFARAADGHKCFAGFVADHLAADTSLVLVAESDRRVVAYCLAAVRDRTPVFEPEAYGMIHDLAVTAACRRAGIGQQLLEAAEDWFRQRGIRRIEARVAVSNEVAGAFWRKVGFVPYNETVYKRIEES